MQPVSLTVLKIGNDWSLQVQDARGIRSLGEAPSRDDIEALALSVMEDARKGGERIDLTIVRSSRARMAA